MSPRRSSVRETLAIAAVTLVGCFAAGEVYVRVRVKESIEWATASSNPRLVYELNPKYPGINSLRMRDDEFRLEDLAQRDVIAVIGDSHSYGYVADGSAAYPFRIEHHLNASRQGGSVKVLNFGVPGYNTAQEVELLQARVLAFKPRLIILQNTINDTHVCNYLQPRHKILNRLIYRSRFLVLLWKRVLYSSWGEKHLYDRIGKTFPDALLFQEGLVGTLKPSEDEEPAHRIHPPRAKDRVPERYHYMLGRENWLKNISLFARICRDNGIPVLATGFVGAEEREAFLKSGVAVNSFHDIMSETDMANYGYSVENTSNHFNAKGNDVIGKALAGYIHTH